MNGLEDLEDLIYVEDMNGLNSVSLMYLNFDTNTPTSENNDLFEDRKYLRSLKINELIDDENNSKKIEELKFRISTVGPDMDSYPTNISPSIKTININTTKEIKFSDDYYLSNIVDVIRKEVLYEISRISYVNKMLNTQLNIDLDFTKEAIVSYDFISRKILSRILIASSFISNEGRIGPGNTAIMSREYAELLSNISGIGLTNNNSKSKYNFGSMAGINIIIDDKIGSKIITYRRPSDKNQLGNNISLFYNLKNDKIDYEIVKMESCQSNYIEFDIKGLYI